MIKKLALASLFVQLLAVAASAETKEGKCALKEGDGFGKGAFKVQVGDKIKGTCNFFFLDFFGKKIISANIEIENTADKPMHCEYFVAFFDKDDKLVGCAGQGTFDEEGLAPGKSSQLGSCLIALPLGVYEKVISYKIAFYESDKQIGKK